MINYNMISEWVVKGIEDVIFDNTSLILSHSKLEDDLKLDSLDILDVVIFVETEINKVLKENNKSLIDIADNETAYKHIEKIYTVEDLTKFIFNEYERKSRE